MAELLVLCAITEEMRKRLEDAFAFVELNRLEDRDGWLSAHGAEVRFILTDGALGVPAEIFAKLPNAQIISSYGVGYDGVDVASATARGVPVCHTPGVLNAEVATTALMLYLACWRDLEAGMAHAKGGAWERDGAPPLSRTADGRTIGILGLGRIGKAVAAKLAPFEPRILYYGRSRQDVPYTYYDDLIAMAHACDTLINVAPGGDGTRHLINRDVIEAIGPEGYLINVGRGSTVDEAALIEAVESGALGGAGLDVFANEPHIPAALRACKRAILLPHVGSATVETRRAMGNLAIDNLIAFKEGRPLLSPVPESLALLSV
ncbi:MAG: 2-hydroxyacid dehydrogenase [Pseudomonadota bacterium]